MTAVEALYATALDLARRETVLDPSQRQSGASADDLAWVLAQLEDPDWRTTVDAAVRCVARDRWRAGHPLTEAVAKLAHALDPASVTSMGARRVVALAELDAELRKPRAARATGQHEVELGLVRQRLDSPTWTCDMVGLGRVLIRDWPLDAPLTRLLLALAQHAEDLA